MAEGSTALSEFNLLVQRVNSLSRSINRLVYRFPMDLKSVEGLTSDLESTMDKVDDVYSVVFDTFGDSLSRNVQEKYDLVSSNSSEVLVNAYKNMMKARESEKSEKDCLKRSQMLENLVSQVNISRLPSPEPDVFDGDPLEYNRWFNAFETLISTRNIPKNERIFYLRKYLSGPARDCVQGLLSLCSEDAYDDAWKMLKERFGSDFVIANALRQKVRNWPQVSSNDYVGLRSFSDFCHKFFSLSSHYRLSIVWMILKKIVFCCSKYLIGVIAVGAEKLLKLKMMVVITLRLKILLIF